MRGAPPCGMGQSQKTTDRRLGGRGSLGRGGLAGANVGVVVVLGGSSPSAGTGRAWGTLLTLEGPEDTKRRLYKKNLLRKDTCQGLVMVCNLRS